MRASRTRRRRLSIATSNGRHSSLRRHRIVTDFGSPKRSRSAGASRCNASAARNALALGNIAPESVRAIRTSITARTSTRWAYGYRLAAGLPYSPRAYAAAIARGASRRRSMSPSGGGITARLRDAAYAASERIRTIARRALAKCSKRWTQPRRRREPSALAVPARVCRRRVAVRQTSAPDRRGRYFADGRRQGSSPTDRSVRCA